MSLFLYECRKIFLQKGFVIITVLAVLLNLFLLNYSIKDSSFSYQPEEYRKMMEDLRELPREEAYRQLSVHKEKLQDAGMELLSDQEIEKLCPYTGEMWDEIALLETGMEELENVTGYDAYLEKIQEDTAKMLGISIFQKNSGYSVRNLKKTAKDFQNMSALNLCFDISQGITWATGFLATDFLGVLLVFATCVFLILNEKQNHQLALVVCTARGRIETGLVKIGTLLLAVFMIVILLYGGNLTYTGLIYGFGDCNRLIQSIPAYHSCILKISVLQYFILFFAGKVLVYFVLGLFAFWCCLYFQQLLHIFCGFFGIIGLEIVAWNLIPVNSSFSALRYWNLFYFLQTDKLFMNYQNVNLFSIPIGSILLAGISFPLLSGICIYGILKEFNGERILMKKNNADMPAFLKNVFFKKFSGVSPGFGKLTGFEYLKIIQKSGGLVFIVLFLIVQFYRIQHYTWLHVPEQIYYRTYMNYLEGPLDERTANYIDEENKRYASLNERLWEIQSEDENSTEKIEIMEKLNPYSAWEKVNMEYEQLLMRQEEEGRALSLVYGDGYKLLDGEEREADMEIMEAFLISLLMILLMAGTFSCDSGQGMDNIISTTSRGKKETLRAKKKIVYFFTFCCFLFVYGADFLKVDREVGLEQFSAPIQSLFYLSDSRFSITLGQYLILLYIIRLVGTYIILHGILAISLFCRNTMKSMLVSSVLFLLPPVLGLLQVKAVEKMTLLPLLTGGDLLRSCLLGEFNVYIVGLIFAGCILGIGSAVYIKYSFQFIHPFR